MGQVGSSGTVEGTITDPSGASIPQATVKAVNVATGVKQPRKTTAAGFYVLAPLPAGEYSVTVTAVRLSDTHPGACSGGRDSRRLH